MKIRHLNQVFYNITLLLGIILFSFCKKTSNTTTTAPESTKGNLVIWSNDTDNRGISINLDGQYKGSVTGRYSSTPGCGASGCVNLELEAGNYQFKTYGPRSNQTSDANITVKKGECVTLQVP